MEEEETTRQYIGAQYVPREEPNYPVIEVGAENTRLKDEMIELLKKRVNDLEREVGYLQGIINYNKEERDVGSHAIAPPFVIIPKPRLRTMSEVVKKLEQRSLNAAIGKVSAEEVNEENKTA